MSEYEKEMEIMKKMSHEEFVAYVRRYIYASPCKTALLLFEYHGQSIISMFFTCVRVAGKVVASREVLQCTEV